MKADPRKMFALVLLVSAGGMAVVGAAFGTTIDSLELRSVTAGAFMDACRWFVPGASGVVGVLLVVLAAVGALAGGRIMFALGRQIFATRRFMRGVTVVGEVDACGSTVSVVHGSKGDAFCAGYLRPRIYVSRGAVEKLSPEQFACVVAHELEHRRRRDPLRLLVARSLGEGMFFLPVIGRLASRYEALAELAADRAAVQSSDRKTLASALLAFGSPKSSGAIAGIAPERVDQLRGERVSANVPTQSLAVAAVTLSAAGAAVIAAASMLADHPVELPALLANLCMATMFVAPLAVGHLVLRGDFKNRLQRLAAVRPASLRG